jgi:hypothetical protein
MSYELEIGKRQSIIDGKIEELKESIFLNEINLAQWQAMEGDWSNQIAGAERAIADAKASIDALTELS